MDLAQSPAILKKLRSLVELGGSFLSQRRQAITLSVLLASVLFIALTFTPTKGLGGQHRCYTDLRSFSLKRISNRIGGSPDQLLMKCVRVGRLAIFKGLRTKYKAQFTGRADKLLPLCYLHF